MRLLQPCGTIIGVSGPPSQTSVSSCLSPDELGVGVVLSDKARELSNQNQQCLSTT